MINSRIFYTKKPSGWWVASIFVNGEWVGQVSCKRKADAKSEADGFLKRMAA